MTYSWLKEFEDLLTPNYRKPVYYTKPEVKEPLNWVAPETEANEPNPDFMYEDWEPAHAYHNVRALCDLAGLNPMQKDEICATIMGESEFKNTATNENRNVHGVVTSKDWGICQINSRYHIGKGLEFADIASVLDHPEDAVGFMIKMYLAGKIDLWCAHSNGSYLHWTQELIRSRLGITN